MSRVKTIVLAICFALPLAACAAGAPIAAPAPAPQPIAQPAAPAPIAVPGVTPLNLPQTDHPNTQDAVVVYRGEDFPCLSCLAWVSGGGGIYGHTAAIIDLHVISDASDVAFPRALQARLESSCSACQPTAFTAQARGLTANTSVFAANFEAYSLGRATVAEFNIGAAFGGYVFDVVPVRMPSGASSQIDSVLKVEGQGGDTGAAQIGSYINAKINPDQGVIIIPAGQGPVTVMQTSDGRMKETWQQDAIGRWSRQIIIDGVVQP